MAMGCLIIGSKTEPVEEVIKDKVNGLLVDFHDHKALAEKVDLVLKNQDDFIKIRKKARETIVKGYDLKTVCLPKQVNLVESLL
ncbi:MAG: glycosyltransferase, partial [Pseudomonadota bacterium]|nr:glycosyltransferase [Pseudomonadota bacterium]